ncbi:MAG TPA: protein kinase [Kofleriaceae bacterium]|nr:protein kinase [Kofleriaceae bacterium]
MRHLCPACQRAFDEPGFCPFDRTPLTAQAPPDASTLPSAAMPIAEALDTDVMRAASAPISAQRPVPSIYDRLVGQTLDGRYYINTKIGEGGMGVVYAARHAVIERPLAIKVLRREALRDTATIKRFIQEAQAASRIGHPNIVDVTDFGTTPDGMTYSVMELVDGETLGATLRRDAPLPMQRAVRIAVQIARALRAAHDKGIVHRDLKPENVFLVAREGRPDFVKIVDFGIAKVAPLAGAPNEPRLTKLGAVFGTPEYMAPEQAAGRSDTDARVDIYALGVILYEMITGRVPHRGETTVRTLAMQMLDPIEPPSKVRPDLAISPAFEAVIMRALAKKREQRYQTMGELLAALEQLQSIVGVSITGSPVYALTPVPPGADPALALSTDPRDEPTAPLPIAIPYSEIRAKPSTKPLHEPEFATRDKPATFDHVFTDSIADRPPRRWPIVVGIAAALGAAGGALALVMRQPETAQPVAMVTPDAAREVEPDATIVIDVADAGVDAADIIVVPVDASVRTVIHRRDAGPLPDAATPNGRGTIAIQVITRPEGATLHVGPSYRGPGGTNLEEPFGSALDVTCKMTGYKPGTVHLVFDGKTEVVVCVLERIKICIDGIKNPFDDCEIAGP